MPDPIASIPGNDRAIAKLREYLDSKQAIAFVGAGVSAPLYPLWTELITKLADEAVNRGLARKEDRDFWLENANRRPQQVVRGIKEALGAQNYGAILREIFRPKVGKDGNRFTAAHSSLLRIPFKSYMTTNYDPGLIEARRVLRTDIPTTGYTTHKDTDNLQRWYTGDIFSEEQSPILFAHGIYERSETMVLGVGEYRDIYKAGLYRRVFQNLWGCGHLIFVGFGFSDTWIDVVADEVITQTAHAAAGEARHIAVIGLPEDKQYTPEMRKLYADQYNAEVIFYPVRGHDHSALLELLEGFTAPVAAVPIPAAVTVRRTMPERWVHETTNDELYVERGDTLSRLDRWTDDQAVRAIAVTSMGGMGKTSLIGYWLKIKGGNTRRDYAGLFYWSFYANRQVNEFFVELLKFAEQKLNLSFTSTEKVRPLDFAKELIQKYPLLIVLDGLEVLQERPGTVGYGMLLEGDLREFLDCACRIKQRGLVLLTSRFPFADLSRYIGSSLCHMDLDHLSNDEGDALLEKCRVDGTEQQRQEVSRHLDGHPLALRVFAAAFAASVAEDPTREFNFVFSKALLGEEQPLHRKLSHLLTFYEEQLSAKRVFLLGILALFRSPVESATIETLARKLPVTQQELGTFTQEQFEQELDKLSHEHLVLRDHDDGKILYSCHPVLRDHFRGVLLGRNSIVASGVADFLTEQPANKNPTDVRELEPVLLAIELLLEAGDFNRANELYTGRLYDHLGSVFLRVAAPYEGMKCALGFVGTQAREAICKEQLPENDFYYYLSSVALHAMFAGEVEIASIVYKDNISVFRTSNSKESLSRQLCGYNSLQIQTGRLEDATETTREAVSIARELKDRNQIVYCLSYVGLVSAMSGQVKESMMAFEEANEIQKHIDDDIELYSNRGVYWAEFLIQIGMKSRASHLTKANLRICEEHKWKADIASCHWILGRIDTEENMFEDAQKHLSIAESTMRRGHMLMELPQILLAQASLATKQEIWEDALHYAGEALDIAAPRGLRLAHADALVMRGRIVYERELSGKNDRDQIELARDDADAGLSIARDCGYAWAERDALILLAETSSTLGEKEKALSYHREADPLIQRLTLEPE